MSQVPQPQSVFVDIHMNNGRRLGARTFNDILNGRFNGDMQLAFEQYLGDFKVHGTAYRTYRYSIVNGNILLLHGVLNPFPAGPALAAPVTQPGRQNTNAQTQAPGNHTPYASQLNQPVANLLGPVDPPTVQNMRYPPASTAQRSVPQPRQLNPRASEFRVGSAVNGLGASARPSALPTANLAPARPPGLPVTQQPQFAPSNAHRGFFAPDDPRAAAGPPMLTRPYSSPIHSHGQAVPQQPQLTPFDARQGHYAPDTLQRSVDNHREAARAAAVPPMLSTPYSSKFPSHVPAIPQKPQLAPSNVQRGFLAPDTTWRLFHNNGEGARAAAGPPMLTRPYSAPSHSHGQAVPQQPQLTPLNTRQGHHNPYTLPRSFDKHREAAGAPASPLALATNLLTASRDSWMASPSPLDLAAVSSSETNYPHLSPRQWSRRSSEHSSDAPSHSSSVQDRSPSSWCLEHVYRCSQEGKSVSRFNWSSYHTANSSVSEANTKNNTSQGPQNGEADTGVAPSPSPPQFQPRYDTDTIEEHILRRNLRPSTAIWGKKAPWNPLSEFLSGHQEPFYSAIYEGWHQSAPPGSDLSDFWVHLLSLPEGLRSYHDVFGLRNPQGPVTTPPPWSSALPSGTVSHHTKSPTVGNGMDTSHEVAEFDTSAARTATWVASDISSRNGIPFPTSPQPQLHYGEGSKPNESSCSDPKAAIEVQLEAQSLVEEEEVDWHLQQRLNAHSLLLSTTIEEVRTTRRDMEVLLS